MLTRRVRVGTAALVALLVEDLFELSPGFPEFWKENDVPGLFGGSVKYTRRPQISSFGLG